MRKNFLILMLLTLLPLAGWAVGPEEQEEYPVDISSGWTIELVGQVFATYSGGDLTPEVRLFNEVTNKYIPANKLDVSWDAAERINVPASGYYTVTVKPNQSATGTYGDFNKTAKLYVLKYELAVTNSGAVALADSRAWNGSPLVLVSQEPELDEDFDGNAKILYSTDNKETWHEGVPQKTAVGEYEVWYKVDGTTNYVGIEPTKIGESVKITGIPYVAGDYTAPEANDLTFAWDTNAKAPKEQELITTGNVINIGSSSNPKGIMKYKYKLSTATDYSADYSENLPKASAAGTYNVMWKIFPAPNTGFIAKEADAPINVTIDALQPSTVTKAGGRTGLTYAGAGTAPQALLASEGSASDGATPKYQFRRKDIGANEYPGDFGAAVEFADVKGSDAGVYEIKTFVPTDGNYLTKVAESTTEVTIAQATALTADPTAIAELTWNKAKQVLIQAGAGTVNGIVEYALTTMEAPTAGDFAAANWVPSVENDAVKGQDAKTYYAWYRVTNPNYVAVAPTAIPNVKIAPKTVSIIVNNASKKYDATGDIDALTVVAPATTKFTVTNAVEGAAVNVATLDYTGEGTGLGDDYKNANTYVGALTASADDVAALNGTWGTNYEYTIVPGNLIVEPRPIYVEAKGSNATFGEEYNISKDYIIKGGETGNVDVDASTATAEQIANFFTTAPVLTAPLATGTPVPVDEYELAFTAGTTSANYTMDLTKGENNDGYFINNKKFTVANDPNHKLVITVLPHTQKYTGVAESWADVNEGVDYVVSGLIAGDVITKKPTFTRSESGKFNVKYTEDPTPVVTSYTLSADGVEVTNKAAHYPGGIVYNNSTFTIEPVELTATVNQQSIAKQAGVEAANITAANAALDQDAWTVEGLVNGENKSVLGGALAVDNVGTAAGKTNISAAEFYNNGIKLTIARGNYTLKAGTEYGILRVIADKTLEFDPNDAELAQKIEENKFVEANNNKVNVTFANRSLEANTWYTMVLPFEVKTTELVGALKNAEGENVYAIVNRMNESTTATEINFTLEMNKIPANEPFLIKAAEDVNMQDVTFENKKIVSDDDPSIEWGGNKFIGTYTAVTNLPTVYNTTDKHFGFLGNASYTGSKGTPLSNIWYNAKLAGLVINPMEAYLHYAYNAEGNAPVITVEDFDFSNNTTAIKTLNTETMKAIEAEGMYNLNGMKLNSVPTQKGVYIINGKKVVIK